MSFYGSGRIGPFLLTYWNLAGNQRFLVFPVAPAQISVKYAHEFNEVSVLGLGQADLMNGDRLAELSFTSFFPRDYDPTLVDPWYYGWLTDLKSPLQYESIIHEIRQVGKPCRLLIGGTNFNAPVMIRSFDVDHKGGEPGDIYFSISFKKHRFLSVRKTDPPAPAASASDGKDDTLKDGKASPPTPSTEISNRQGNGRPSSGASPQNYTVVSGDTLWGIAKRFLGNGARWQEIYSLNKSVIGSDPNLIRPGQTLRIPAAGGSADAPSLAGAMK